MLESSGHHRFPQEFAASLFQRRRRSVCLPSREVQQSALQLVAPSLRCQRQLDLVKHRPIPEVGLCASHYHPRRGIQIHDRNEFRLWMVSLQLPEVSTPSPRMSLRFLYHSALLVVSLPESLM